MTSIKVTYQSTIRRFTVPNTITWSDLESKLRLLFYLPPTFELALSYKDEDEDTIVLSTDLELQEFLSSQPSQSTLKFHIVPERRPNVIVAENEFVSVEKEGFIPDDVSESDNHVAEVDMADDDDDDESYFEPTTLPVSKGKQKESPAEPQPSAANDQQHEEHQSPPSNDNDNERQAPFIDLAEQFQRLLDQFQDVLSKNPQLIEQVNVIMDQILRNIPMDIDQLAQWLNSFRPEGDLGEGETDRPRGEQQPRQQQRQANEFGPFGNLSSFIPPHVLSNPWIQKVFQDVSTNNPGFTHFGNLSGTNGGCPFRQQREEGLSQEALKEKINLLHKMGFWEDDVKNEELLRRYNGNIERVVEILIEQRDGRQ